jgi:chromosome partitioning protein
MSRVFVVAGHKGGVGKSTTAFQIAQLYAAADFDVLLADLDRYNHSARDWATQREANGVEPRFRVEVFASARQALEASERAEILVCDLPANADERLREVIGRADRVLLPTGLGVADLRATVRLAHELTPKRIAANKLRPLLMRAGDNEREQGDARAYLAEAGYSPLDAPAIRDRVAYRRAQDAGLALTEVQFPSLREEADALCEALMRFLTPEFVEEGIV